MVVRPTVTMTPPLTIEMVPRPLHGKSLAKQLPRWIWHVLSCEVRELAESRCQTCGAESGRLDCHEVWAYDDERHIARLVGLKALCGACHLSTHPGRAASIGWQGKAFAHLMEVNGWTWVEARLYAAHAQREWVTRSRHAWTLDVAELPAVVPPGDVARLAAGASIRSMKEKLGPYLPRLGQGAESAER